MPRAVSLFIGLRYTLARQQSRSVAFISRVAMIGIVLGVALLLTVLSVMNGFDRELRERILHIMPQVTIYQSGGMADWSLVREQVLQHSQVRAASPFVELHGMANHGQATQPVLVYGIDSGLEQTTSIIHQFLQDETLSLLSSSEPAIVLGANLASELNVAPGDTVNIIIPRAEGAGKSAAIRRLPVVDILTTGTEVDTSLALMNLELASDMTVFPGQVSGLHLKVDDLFAAPIIANELRALLPRGFYTSNWTRTHGNLYYAIQMSKNLVSLLLWLIIGIAAFNVVSTLVMVVVDKQSDIAILRTLGMSNRQVIGVFIVQGTAISVIGTLIGIVLGLLLALFISDIVQWVEAIFAIHFLKGDIYPISYMPSQILLVDVVLVAGISIFMSLIATLYPAWRAAKVRPADALRYDN